MAAVREKVDYQPGVTHVKTSAAQAFARGAGVCQDHAHVFVSCCRQLNIPARYVSGYLAPKNGPANANGADTEMASHAWAEAWIDGVGWQGFDVANQVRAHGPARAGGGRPRLPGRMSRARISSRRQPGNP
jgi:transglutaminase-like putative cysteine protease